MAQLRDSRTSELVAEGTAEEVALAAERLGHNEVLFDDVGQDFDPAAVVAAYRDRVDGLARAAAEARADPDVDETSLEEAHASEVSVEAESVPALVSAAEQALHDARQLVE